MDSVIAVQIMTNILLGGLYENRPYNEVLESDAMKVQKKEYSIISKEIEILKKARSSVSDMKKVFLVIAFSLSLLPFVKDRVPKLFAGS